MTENPAENTAENIPGSVTILVVSGVEGPSIYVNNCRIAGNKPWGGGTVVHSWTVRVQKLRDDLRRALDFDA